MRAKAHLQQSRVSKFYRVRIPEPPLFEDGVRKGLKEGGRGKGKERGWREGKQRGKGREGKGRMEKGALLQTETDRRIDRRTYSRYA